MKSNAELLAGLGVHLLLLGLPALAAAVLATWRGVRNVPLLLGISLAVSGTTAFLAFWAYYASPTVGQAWDFLLLFGSIAALLWAWRAGGIVRSALAPLAVPFGLWVLGAAFIVFLGFIHGGTDEAVSISAQRFAGQLPSDNDIPRYFVEWFSTHGHSSPPTYPPDWLMSDRPPLQIGYVLAQRGFFHTERALHYELICVGIQSFWILGMWAVLVAAKLRARTRALAMLAALVSDIAILHGFYVWPKLIAAAFLLAALALVISPEWSRERRRPWVGALIGALLALAMLSHGSSIFGVIPLVVFAIYRGLPSWRWLAVAVVAGLTLMVPWMAYQHYANPPGNRLLKWQLGGDIALDSKGTLEAIEDGYDEAGWDGTLDNKVDNFGEIVGWPRVEDEIETIGEPGEGSTLERTVEAVRGMRFFSLLPFLGLLLIAPLAMVAARRRGRNREEWRFALLCFAFFGLACLFWGLLLFGTPDSRATIHVGSLAVPLLGLVGCVAGLCAVAPRLATWVVAVNATLAFLLYLPSLTPPLGTSYSPIAAILMALSLAGFGLLAFERAPSWLPARLRPASS